MYLVIPVPAGPLASTDSRNGKSEPYDYCTDNAFYDPCPNDSCVPGDEDVRAFYAAWKKVAPRLLNMSQEEFREHVYVSEFNGPKPSALMPHYRVDFFIVKDWVVIRDHHGLTLRIGAESTQEKFEDWFFDRRTRHQARAGLPSSVVEETKVLEAFENEGMQPDFCNMRLVRLTTVDDPKPEATVFINGSGIVDEMADECKFGRYDLSSGSFISLGLLPCSVE